MSFCVINIVVLSFRVSENSTTFLCLVGDMYACDGSQMGVFMKKKIALFLTTMLAVGVLSGCGAKEPASLKDTEVEKYVTLGEYKGLEINTQALAGVNEAEVEALLNQVYQGAISLENGGIIDRAVEEGDTINLDYEGKKDDVAFDGGTAAGQSLTIGAGQFIDGFEEGLVGVMPGETVDLDLSFPEVYDSNPDLAGAAVVFTVTVNYIMPTDLKDEVVAGLGEEEFTTVEELRQYVTNYLEQTAQQQYDSNVENLVLEAFMLNNTYKEMPESLLQSDSEMIRESITSAAAQMGIDADTYSNYYYQSSLEDYISTYGVEATKQGVAFQAVANVENLNISDEELDTMLTEYATNANLATIEELIGDTPKENFRKIFMFQSVMDFLIENANITAE